MSKKILAAVAALCLYAGQAALTPVFAQSVSERGGILADASGRTLYTFDKDAPGKSNCYDACAANWPPFAAKEGAQAKGDYSVVTRDDGSRQWAYKSMPLYYFAADAKPGDATGDGKNGVWHVVPLRKEAVSAYVPVIGNPDY